MELLIILFLGAGAYYSLKELKEYIFGKPTPNEPPPSQAEYKKLERKLGQVLNRFDKLYERMVGLERQVRELERLRPQPPDQSPQDASPSVKPESLAPVLKKTPAVPATKVPAKNRIFDEPDDADFRIKPETVPLPPPEPIPAPAAVSQPPIVTARGPLSDLASFDAPVTLAPVDNLPELPRLLQESDESETDKVVASEQEQLDDLREDLTAPAARIKTAPIQDIVQANEASKADSSAASPEKSLPEPEPTTPSWTANFENIDWASFLGTKLFAWLGGFALFLGMAYFVSYAIENNIITIEMRVALGFILGLGSIAGGLFLQGRDVPLTVHGLCAAGVAILYADIVAARVYDLFGITPTLILMVTNTVTAFTLAVRLDAQFVAILGLVGGFLTPPILSTGHDNPFGLFGYVLLLNCGLLAVTRRKGWSLLIGLGAIGTVLMQLGWAHKFIEPEKALIGAGVVLLFAFFYTAAWHLTRRCPLDGNTVLITAQSVPLVSFWYPAFLLIWRSMSPQASLAPAILFGLEIPLFILAWSATSTRTAWGFGQVATFALLALWGERFLVPETLLLGFVAFLIPAVAAFLFRFAAERAGRLEALTFITWEDPSRTADRARDEEALWVDPIRLAARITPLASFFFVFQWMSRTPPAEGPLAAFLLLFLFDLLIGWQARTDLEARTCHLWAAIGTGGMYWLAIFQGLVTSDTSAQFIFVLLFGLAFYFGTWLHFYHQGDRSQRLSLAARLMPIFALTLVGYLMTVRGIGEMTFLIIDLILVIDIAIAYQAWHQRGAGFFHRLGAMVNFILIWVWCLQGNRPLLMPWTTWGVILFCPLLYFVIWQADFWRRTASDNADGDPINAPDTAVPPSPALNAGPTEPSPLAGTPFDGLFEDESKPIQGPNPDFAFVAASFPVAAMTYVGYLLLLRDLAPTPWFAVSLAFIFQAAIAWQAWNQRSAQIWHLCAAIGGTLLVGIWYVQALEVAHVVNAWLLAFAGPTAYAGFWYLAHRRALSSPVPHLWENGTPGTLAEAISLPARLLPIMHGVFAFAMMNHPGMREKPLICLSLLFALDLLLAAQTLRDDGARPFHFAGSVTAFILLLFWCNKGLTDANLALGLGFFLIFALLHAVLPILLQRLRPTTEPYLLGYLLAPMMLILMMIPLSTHEAVSFLLWPAILVVNLATLITAWMLAWVWAALAMLILTMSTLGLWAWRLSTVEIPHFLAIEVFFAFLFHGWGFFMASRKTPQLGNLGGTARLFLGLELPERPSRPVEQTGTSAATVDTNSTAASETTSKAQSGFSGLPGVTIDEMTMVVMPSLSAFLPFLLLMMVVARLPIPDPSLVFGLAMILVLLLLRMAQLLGTDLLVPISLISTSILEFQWHTQHFSPDRPWAGIGWYLAFAAIFFLFPFPFRNKFSGRLHPWMASSLSGVIHFYLLYLAIGKAWGYSWMGILPAALAIPHLAGLFHLERKLTADSPLRMTILALFGGVSLFFITLIFPIQFDRQWWTVGWALEGAALLWLYRRVPHDGLKAWGVALLLLAFARLGLNQEVLVSYPRGGMVILNWYLYAYSTTAIALLLGASWLPADRDRLFDHRIPPILQTLAGLLLFLLLNLEIADSFSTGPTLTFDIFSANLGRSMTYSIGWSLFGLGLLSVGIAVRKRNAILCSLALLVVTIFKVFFYDLWNLEGLYKVASLIGLAGSLLLVSAIYQKFAVNALGGKSDTAK